MESLVADTSVFVDYFVVTKGKEVRYRIAVEFFNRLAEINAIVYEPFLFDVELSGVLAR